MKPEQLFDNLWKTYVKENPMAQKVYDLFTHQGNTVVNDHIAFRTFDDSKVNIAVLSKAFIEFGYKKCGDYVFPEKKLYAEHFEHENKNYPTVFISELKTKELSAGAQEIIKNVVDQIEVSKTLNLDFCNSGRTWKLSYADYQKLSTESEYAAWLCAWGFRANHFTVLVNRLTHLNSIETVNTFLKENGIKLNSSGGEVKGTPEVYLEQSSTLADSATVEFSDGSYKIPACYYEFAKRYEVAPGKLYSGFVAKSADKIFESTNSAQS